MFSYTLYELNRPVANSSQPFNANSMCLASMSSAHFQSGNRAPFVGHPVRPASIINGLGSMVSQTKNAGATASSDEIISAPFRRGPHSNSELDAARKRLPTQCHILHEYLFHTISTVCMVASWTDIMRNTWLLPHFLIAMSHSGPCGADRHFRKPFELQRLHDRPCSNPQHTKFRTSRECPWRTLSTSMIVGPTLVSGVALCSQLAILLL
jgi:hypothetical protein